VTLFKGYIPTKNKKCLQKFKDVKELNTLEDVQNLSEYAGILAEDTILIDIDDQVQSEILMNIVEDLQLKCKVLQTTRGKHFYFKNSKINKNATHAKLACGLEADIKLGTRNSYSVLKFNNEERFCEWDIEEQEEYEEIPKFLYPVKSNINFLNLEEGDGRNQTLFNYILTLQNNDFSNDEIRSTITLINKYVLKDKLNDRELNTILRDEAFEKPSFYNGNTFLFDKFAMFLKNNNHIIKINNQLHIYKDGIYVNGLNEIEHMMIFYIPNLSKAKRSEVLNYLDVLIRDNTEPSSANLIAFKNGVYNIATDEFSEFDSNMIITNRIDWNYNPIAYNEICDNTLNKLACNDNSIRNLLEEMIGYCFYRRNELGVSFILTGDKSNGKSTFIDMVMRLLGFNNTSALDLGELGDRFKTAELFGKLANLGDDISDDFIKNPAIFKKLVTGDRVNVERKGQDPFDFNNYAKFLFSANDIPRIKDKTGAVLRRLIIIPFNATFSKNDPDYDPYIKYKLRDDSVMEYLIVLGLKGLKRVLENRKFTTNDKVEAELKEYEERNNPITLFFKDTPIEEIENEPINLVYDRYKEFCISNDLQNMSNIEFSRLVHKHYDLETKVMRSNGKLVRVYIRKG